MFDGSCRTAPVRWVRPRSGHVGVARQECRGQRRGRRDMRATVAIRKRRGHVVVRLSLLVSFVARLVRSASHATPPKRRVSARLLSAQRTTHTRKDRREKKKRKERKNSHTSIRPPSGTTQNDKPQATGTRCPAQSACSAPRAVTRQSRARAQRRMASDSPFGEEKFPSRGSYLIPLKFPPRRRARTPARPGTPL